MVIPLKFSKTSPDYLELEDLMIDYWSLKLENKDSYIPSDKYGKKVKSFDFQNFFKQITKMNLNFYFYLGSHATPPCLGNSKYYLNK